MLPSACSYEICQQSRLGRIAFTCTMVEAQVDQGGVLHEVTDGIVTHTRHLGIGRGTSRL